MSCLRPLKYCGLLRDWRVGALVAVNHARQEVVHYKGHGPLALTLVPRKIIIRQSMLKGTGFCLLGSHSTEST